ncbi:MAG: TetR/AcrR family transcriptional regulator, partial [Erysipelotrichaceae bacterium]|nr:TetR/AcrR family transcriptional regulator [Erysipelotrichaceae bacterium]
AAFQLMTNKNIQDISISEITRYAGIAKGTFYLYFKDKYDLRDFLVAMESAKMLDRAREQLEENDIRGFEDAIVFLIHSVISQLEANPVALNFIRHNLSRGVFQSVLSKSWQEDTHNILPLFRKMAAEAGYHYKNPDVILFMILELTSSVCYNSILHDVPMPFHEIKGYLFNSIRALLRQEMPA